MKNFLVSLLFLCASVAGLAQATQLQGTLNNPDGSGFNGILTLSLAQQASISSTNGCGGPVLVPSTVPVTITFKNGAMVVAPKIYGSDCTLPYGVPYNVVARDTNGNVDFTAQWLPLGAIQDIGTIQTVVNPLGTLFGLSLSDIALTGAQNIFTENNTFQQNVSINGDLIVSGTITTVAGNPVVVQGNGNAVDFEVKNSAGSPVFLVYDTGIVTVAANYLNVAGVVDSNTGFVVNGNGGTSGQCLVSNGIAFIPGTCGGSGGTPVAQPFYYKWASHAVFVPQEAYANFNAPLVATDNPLGGRTDISLALSGATAGTYASPSSIVVDGFGRITAIAAGTTNAAVIKVVTVGSAGICTTGSGAFASCFTSIIWPGGGFVDAGYVPTCTAGTPTNQSLTAVWIDTSSVTRTGLQFWIQNGDSNAAHSVSLSSIYCIAIHP